MERKGAGREGKERGGKRKVKVPGRRKNKRQTDRHRERHTYI